MAVRDGSDCCNKHAFHADIGNETFCSLMCKSYDKCGVGRLSKGDRKALWSRLEARNPQRLPEYSGQAEKQKRSQQSARRRSILRRADC